MERRPLLLRRGVEGAGRAILERDLVCGVERVRGRGLVCVVGSAGGGHDTLELEEDREIQKKKRRCRSRRAEGEKRAESRTEIERIYISQHLSLSRPLQPNPPPPESQPWADERSKSSQLPSVLSLSPPRSHTHILFFSPAREEQIRHFPKGLSLSSTRCSHLTLAFQRKNGLFKKAYELGVLCSVDVAVIVFDNKQGGPRLYQYGSDDVITIVERAMRVRPTPLPLSPADLVQFEGDRDTKRPCDFNARSLEDNDEEDDEDESHTPTRTSKKRTESGSIKPTSSSQSRPQQISVSVSPPNKRARIDSIEIPSHATPSTSSAPPLPSAPLHPSLQSLLSQPLHSHIPPSGQQLSLTQIYNMVQQQSESPAALLNLLRSGGLQSSRFTSQQPSQNPSEGFLASLAELASANPTINDIGNGLSGYGLGGGAGAFDWPTGLGSSSNPQEQQPSTSPFPYPLTHSTPAYSAHYTARGADDGPSWLDFLTAPQSNPVNGIPPLPLHNPQNPHPHPHHPASFLNHRNFSTGPGHLPSLSPSLGGLSQLNLSRFSGSEDPRSARRQILLDNTYSPWASDASSQSGRSDSSMSVFRPSQAAFSDHDRRLEVGEVPPGSVTYVRSPLP